MKRFVSMAAVAATFLAAGCGWKQDGLAHLQEQYGPEDAVVADPGPSDPGPKDNGPADHGGTDVPDVPAAKGMPVRIVMAGEINVLGSMKDLTTTDYFVAVADGATYALTFCGELATTDPLYKSELPEATAAAMRDTAPALPKGSDGGVLAATLKWNWGLKSAADADPLPTEAADPRVVDVEGDGKPGFTVVLPALFSDEDPEVPAERYMVKRTTWNLTAAAPANQRVTGPVAFVLDQESLGSTNAMAAMKVPVQPKTEGSTYAIRLDQNVTCADLMTAPDAPFAP